MAYIRCVQDDLQIGWHDISNAAVAGAANITALDDVPERNSVGKQEIHFLLNGIRHRLAKQRSHHAPESILRMPVIECDFSGFPGRQGTEYENLGGAVKNRGEGM